MNYEDFKNHPVTIASFEDLISHEREIVRRVNLTPNGGHLFLIDPLRFLDSVGITVASLALTEWRKHIGNPSFGKPSQKSPYEAIRDTKGSRSRFTFRALFKGSSTCR